MIGNIDCHIKNYSLLYSDNLKSVRLAPAYDIVATRVYNMTPEMSFYIAGETDIRKIKRDHFRRSADEFGMSEKLVLKTFDELLDSFETSVKTAADQLNQLGFQDAKKMAKQIITSGGYRNN